MLSRNSKIPPRRFHCFTDRSILRNRVGFVYSIGEKTTSCHHPKIASILTAELQAIFQCLEQIQIPFPSHFLNPSSSARILSLLTHCHQQHMFSITTRQPHPYPSLHLLHHQSHRHLHLGSQSPRHSRK